MPDMLHLRRWALSEHLACIREMLSSTWIAGEHKAEGDLWLSPEARLLADAPTGSEDVVYDGCGHRIVLPREVGPDDPLPLILVGAGKTLLLRNVRVVHAASLPACLQLAPGTLALPSHLHAAPAHDICHADICIVAQHFPIYLILRVKSRVESKARHVCTALMRLRQLHGLGVYSQPANVRAFALPQVAMPKSAG